MTTQETAERRRTFADLFGTISSNIQQVIQGKAEVIDLVLLCLVAEGHLLLEDVPGVGKTSMAKALARSVEGAFGRVQFTPDLLPSDVVGVTVWNRNENEFEFRPGPIFNSILVADEINRASPKTQSALLEAMAEGQVTVDNATYPLGSPFMVIATQNPIDHEGTYPLPESQLDRFLIRVTMGYPSRDAELDVLDRHGDHNSLDDLGPVATARDIQAMIAAVRTVHVAPSLKAYLVDLAEATRRHAHLTLGMSPRSTLSLQRVARARAAAAGRNYVVPGDIKALAENVLAHRLLVTPEAQLQGITATDALGEVLQSVPVPRRPGDHVRLLTRQGWLLAGVAVALLVAGRLLGTLELFLLGVVTALLVIGCCIYVRAVRPTVDLVRELHPPRVHAGTPSRVDLRVRNLGTRSTPVLGLHDAVSRTRGAHLIVGPLEPGMSVRAAYRLPTDRRGILTIGPLETVRGDPFGLASITTKASGISELTIYPHVDEVRPIPQTTGNDPMAGADHPNALGRSGEDFYALRRYVVGDDLRRVHWPSTARHDELMVRQDELPWQARATLLVDVRATTNSPESLELLVSAAASVVNACGRRQDLIRLVNTDGTDSGFAAGHAHIDSIMEHLASVEASPDPSFQRVVDRLTRSSTGGALVVLAAAMPSDELDQLSRLRKRFGSVLIVQFDRSSWDPTVAPSSGAGGRERILRVTGARSFPEVWNSAVHARRTDTIVRRPATDEPDEDRWAAREDPAVTAIAPPRPADGQPSTAAPAPAGPDRAPARSAPRYLAPAEIGLVAVTVAAVLGFNRVFADGAFLPPLLIVAVVAHALCWAGRRRGLSVPVVGLLAVPVFALVASWLFFWSTTLPLIPTAGTLDATRQAFSQSWATFQTIVPPAPTETGFILASCIAVYFAVFLADWAAFRLWSALEAIVPALTLFIFCSLFGAGEQRELATGVFAAAALAFLLLHRTAQRETSAGWLTADVGRGSDSVVRTGALLAAVAVIGGVVVGPYLPTARSPQVIPWKGDGRNPTRTVISPLVNIQDRLLNQSNNEVFTVEADHEAYWRLTSLEEFTSEAWQAHGVYQPASEDLATPPQGAGGTELRQTFHITGLGAAWVPAAYLPTRLESTSKDIRFQDESATLIVKQDDGNDDATSDDMTYTVVSQIPNYDAAALDAVRLDMSDEFKDRYTQLPADFSPYAKGIAESETRDAATNYQKALALEQFFSGPGTQFKYNQQVVAGHGETAIERFLTGKEGYCEQFAGAYAAMARSIGLPSRVAVGFTYGDQDPTNPKLWRVTGKYAHAWPEVYFGPSYGWVAFEPTPGRGAPGAEAWTGLPMRQEGSNGTQSPTGTTASGATATNAPGTGNNAGGANPEQLNTAGATPTTAPPTTGAPEPSFIGVSSPSQVVATTGLSIVFLAVVFAAYAALVVALRHGAHRRRRERARDASAAVLVAWHECLEHLSLFGLRPGRTETPDEFAQRAAPYLDELAGDVLQFAAIVDAASYAPEVLDPSEAARAAEITAAVDAHVRSRTTALRQWQDRLDPRDLLADHP